jgi:hypothetical protein
LFVFVGAGYVAALRLVGGPFGAFGRTVLKVLFAFGYYSLFCGPYFPPHHAYQVVQTLAQNAQAIPGARPVHAGATPVPIHAGARAYALGEPMPPPSAAGDGPIPIDHVH